MWIDKYKPKSMYDDMSQYNRLGLFGVDPVLSDAYSDMKISDTSFNPNVNISTIPDFINPPGQIDDTGIQYSVPSANPEEYDFFSNAMAEITDKDIQMMNTPVGQMMDYDTFKAISGNESLTPQEFEQLKSQVG